MELSDRARYREPPWLVAGCRIRWTPRVPNADRGSGTLPDFAKGVKLPRCPLTARFSLVAHLILQPVALCLLPALCNSILRVANNSRQLSEVTMVSFDSARMLNE